MARALRALSLLLVLWCILPVLPAAAGRADAPAPTQIYPTALEDLSPRIAGRPSDFDATLASGDQPVANEVLTLWLRPEGAADFVAAGQAVTDASGRATVWAVLERNAVVRWTHGAGPSYAASTSTDYVVLIAPRVTARVNDRTLRRGQRFVVTGRTFPAKAGCAVALWRGELRPLASGPAPVRLARTTARADGSYRLVRHFHKRTRMRVAVTVAGCSGNTRGLSRTIGIRVR